MVNPKKNCLSLKFRRKIFAKCAMLESHDEEEINLLFTGYHLRVLSMREKV